MPRSEGCRSGGDRSAGGPDLAGSGRRRRGPERRPTLLAACANATTTAEARYRIDAPDPAPRAARVVALDSGAVAIVADLARRRWRGGRFLAYEDAVSANGHGGDLEDAALRTTDGAPVLLSDELTGADIAVMVATSQARADAAAVIGDCCVRRGVASAGLVVAAPPDGGPDPDPAVDRVVSALRPNAMVLVVLHDAADIPEILTALRC